jgi:hypothetical protein
VENSVDGLRESHPSTGSAGESYALVTKSPSQKNIILFNELIWNVTSIRSLAAQRVDPAQLPVAGSTGEVHISLQRTTSTICSAKRYSGRTMMKARGT